MSDKAELAVGSRVGQFLLGPSLIMRWLVAVFHKRNLIQNSNTIDISFIKTWLNKEVDALRRLDDDHPTLVLAIKNEYPIEELKKEKSNMARVVKSVAHQLLSGEQRVAASSTHDGRFAVTGFTPRLADVVVRKDGIDILNDIIYNLIDDPVWRVWQDLLVPPPQEALKMHITRDEALRFLQGAEPQIDLVRHPLIRTVQSFLDQLSGKSFGDIEDNQAVTARVQQLLSSLGLRVECPLCHQPATIQCRKITGYPAGYFQYLHNVSGRIVLHCGSASLPDLKAIPAPPDRRRKASRTSERSAASNS